MRISKLILAFGFLVVLASLNGCASLNEDGNGNMRSRPEPIAIPLPQTTPPQQAYIPPQHNQAFGQKTAQQAPKEIFGTDRSFKQQIAPPSSNPTNIPSLEKIWKTVQNNSYRITNNEKSISELSRMMLAMRSMDRIALRIGSFSNNSTDTQPLIDQILKVKQEAEINKMKVVEILGFSDPNGDDKKNYELSKLRASAVACLLIDSCEKNIVMGMGEARYHGSISDNRCVIVILEKE